MSRLRDDLVNRAASVIAFIVLALTPLACARSPAAPENAATLLGTWSGPLAAEGMSGGTMTLTVTRQIGVDPLLRVAGDWMAVYADARFNGAGTFSGGSTSAEAISLELSPMVVACPGQPGGTTTKSALATLAVDGRRMSGRLVVLDCPGGEMVLSRR